MANPLEQLQQQVSQRRQELAAVRSDIESFDPRIEQSQQQLLKASPFSQVITKAKEILRGRAKTQAIEQVSNAQKQFESQVSEIPFQKAQESEAILADYEQAYRAARDTVFEGQPGAFQLENDRQREFYINIKDYLRKGQESAAQAKELTALGLKPVYVGGELKGFEDVKGNVSYQLEQLPNFRQLPDIQKLENIGLIDYSGDQDMSFSYDLFTPAPEEQLVSQKALPSALRFFGQPAEKVREAARKIEYNVGRLAEYLGVPTVTKTLGEEAIPQRVTIGGEFMLPEREIDLISPQVLGSAAGAVLEFGPLFVPGVGEALLVSTAAGGTAKAIDPFLPTEERISGGIEAGLSIGFLGAGAAGKLVSGSAKTELGLTEKELHRLAKLTPDSPEYYALRAKGLRNIEKSIQLAESDAGLLFADQAKITATARARENIRLLDSVAPIGETAGYTAQKRASERLLQERLNLLGGEGFTTPIRDIEFGLGGERLTKQQISILANDLVRAGRFETKKEAVKSLREGAIGVSRFRTYLPGEMDIMTGALGDIPKTIKLPRVSGRQDIMSREFTQMFFRGTTGKEGIQRQLVATFGIGARGRPIDLRLGLVRIPKGGKFAEIIPFERGRASKRALGDFILESASPLRRFPSRIVKIKRGAQKKIADDLLFYKGKSEVRILGGKPVRETPAEFFESLYGPIPSSKSLGKRFRKGFPSLETREIGITKIGGERPFSKITKRADFGDFKLLSEQAGLERDLLTISFKSSSAKAPLKAPRIRTGELSSRPKRSPIYSGAGQVTEQELRMVAQQAAQALRLPSEIRAIKRGGQGRRVRTKTEEVKFFPTRSAYAGTGLYERTEGGLLPGDKRITRQDNILIPLQEPKIRELERIKPIQEVRLDVGLAQKQEAVQIPRINERQLLLPAQISESAQRQRATERLSSISMQRAQEIRRLSGREFNIPRPRSPQRTRRPRETTTPGIKLDVDDFTRRRRAYGRKRGERGLFFAELRRRGKFRKVTALTSLEKAIGLGKQVARTTLGASIRVRRATGEIIPIAPTQEFIPSKRDKFILVQKRGARLSSLGERAEIKRARRAKQIRLL